MKPGVACQTVVSILMLSLSSTSCSEPEAEKMLASIELEDVAAYWAVRGQNEEKEHFIRPVVRFRVVNGGERELGYVQAMAVFKIESFPDEPWGNAFTYSISEEPIPPGESSGLITMRSDHNVISKDTPEQMFENEKWEDVDVEIFLRVGPSKWRVIKAVEVPRRIGAPGLEQFLNNENKGDVPLADKS